MDVQNLQNQLMASQQIIINLTNELDEAHALLAHKESDCTRLARELGGSQVREAQEKSRLNQELRQTVQEHDLKFSQKLEEVRRHYFVLSFYISQIHVAFIELIRYNS